MLGISSIQSFFSPKQNISENNSVVDIVIYATSLASNPVLVEPYTEKLREITAKIQPGEKKISSEIQSALAVLYLEIEKYLIEKEPVKKMTTEALRENIKEKFSMLESTSPVFWKHIFQ